MENREKNIRASAKVLGLIVKKSRARKWSLNNQLQYQILDSNNATILLGENFNSHIEQVEKFLCDYFHSYAENVHKLNNEAQNMYVEIVKKRLKIRC